MRMILLLHTLLTGFLWVVPSPTWLSNETQSRYRSKNTTIWYGKWLNENLPTGITITGPGVGSIGYYYRLPVIGACVLVSTEATPFLPVFSENNINRMALK